MIIYRKTVFYFSCSCCCSWLYFQKLSLKTSETVPTILKEKFFCTVLSLICNIRKRYTYVKVMQSSEKLFHLPAHFPFFPTVNPILGEFFTSWKFSQRFVYIFKLASSFLTKFWCSDQEKKFSSREKFLHPSA